MNGRKIQTQKITYRDENDRIISKEEFDRLVAQFDKEVDDAYNKEADAIVERINRSAHTDVEKLWKLFDYLTSEEMIYYLERTDGGFAINEGYKWNGHTHFLIDTRTKYPVLLLHKGVCENYSLAFADLANRLGIPCRQITGFTSMHHAWNVVLIDDEVKHIDVTYAIMYRNTPKRNYFLNNDLGKRRIDSSLADLVRDMRKQEIAKRVETNLRASKGESTEPRIRILLHPSTEPSTEPRIRIK